MCDIERHLWNHVSPLLGNRIYYDLPFMFMQSPPVDYKTIGSGQAKRSLGILFDDSGLFAEDRIPDLNPVSGKDFRDAVLRIKIESAKRVKYNTAFIGKRSFPFFHITSLPKFFSMGDLSGPGSAVRWRAVYAASILLKSREAAIVSKEQLPFSYSRDIPRRECFLE